MKHKTKKKENWFKETWNNLSNWGKRLVYMAGFVLTVITIFEVWTNIREKSLSPAEKLNKIEHQEGDLKPKKLFNYYEPEPTNSVSTKPVIDKVPIIKGIKIKKLHSGGLNFQYGSNMVIYDISQLYEGVNIFKGDITKCDSSIQLIMGIRDDRLYTSVMFKDLEKEENIGWIEFNHWNLYLPNLTTFYNDDSTLEVKDKHNRIVFSLKYIEVPGSTSATIQLNGYFISPNSVLVHVGSPYMGVKTTTRSQCISKEDKKWKGKIEAAVATIVSVKPRNAHYKL